MVGCFDKAHVARVSGCHFIELFSGKARTAKRASWMGYKARAMDIAYSPALDLLKPAGFRLLGFKFVKSRPEFSPGLDPLWLPQLSHCPHCDRVFHICARELWYK